MKKLTSIATALFCTLSLTVCSADKAKPAAAVTPTTEDQKTLYALGYLMSQSLGTFELKPEEFAMVQKGLADGVGGQKGVVNAEEYLPKVQALQQARLNVAKERIEKEGADYLTKAAAESGATKTPSGMVIKQVAPGTGASPKAEDQVKVHYTGKLINGKVFDSSVERGEPATFPLNGVIPCWTEGVQTMKVGGKAQFVCPANLAYGDRGSPPNIMPGSTLVFDVELLDIVKQK
ncbi:MAG TPA: FKBP-type peptidyl-prolyl cis-trans isomerase [Steroidobacteraceae bacterium]|nr:FKBP-type peptidyl-prolyl cis-trans isomerase [Steroidobacteraceae bacterium]